MTKFMYEGTPYDMKEMPTKQLLRILREIRHLAANNYHYDEILDEMLEREQEEIIAKIKKELATREHVPNKQEAREIRQRKMKEKRNR